MPESLKLTSLFVGLNLCTTNPGPELKGNKADTNTVFHNESPQYLIAGPKLQSLLKCVQAFLVVQPSFAAALSHQVILHRAPVKVWALTS